MRYGPRYRVPFRRRRSHRTDYRARLKLLSSSLPRAVVRRSLKYVSVQITEFDPTGDRIVASALSKELKELGWDASFSTTPAAYLVGYLAGKKAVGKGVKQAVLDIGLRSPSKGSRVFAALKGMCDAGLSIPHDPGVLPSKERLSGAHLGKEIPEKFKAVKSKLEAGAWKKK